MLFKFIVAVCFLFPLLGVWLMEGGAFGGSVNKTGEPNGATLAFALYCTVALLTVWIASRFSAFRRFGQRSVLPLQKPESVTFRAAVLLLVMLAFLLFGLGGIDNYYGRTNAGEYRASMGAAGGLLYGIIIKYLAPSLFAFAFMTNVAWDNRRMRSGAVLLLGITMMLIGGSTGYKSAFVLAVLPAAILYWWRASPWMIAPLGAVAITLILFGYLYFANIATLAVAVEKMVDRLFVLQGDVAWLVWGKYVNDDPLPPYGDTLWPIAGNRIFSWMTGITPAMELEWITSNFGLMVTHLSGYSTEVIMAGHNNTATPFTEGIIAGGLYGVVIFAVAAGLVVTLAYNFIGNRLKTNDFASAAVAASYFVNGIMAWLISGGLAVLVHISIPVLILITYLLLRSSGGWSRDAYVPI